MKTATKGAAPRPNPVSADDAALIVKIAQRYAKIAADLGRTDPDTMAEAVFVLERCHTNCQPLQLQRMVDWQRDFDIVHDVAGLMRHLNYAKGKFILSDCFLPRFADLKAGR